MCCLLRQRIRTSCGHPPCHIVCTSNTLGLNSVARSPCMHCNSVTFNSIRFNPITFNHLRFNHTLNYLKLHVNLPIKLEMITRLLRGTSCDHPPYRCPTELASMLGVTTTFSVRLHQIKSNQLNFISIHFNHINSVHSHQIELDSSTNRSVTHRWTTDGSIRWMLWMLGTVERPLLR